MSQFGLRTIPIISKGPAVPDFSDANAIADVSRAFTDIARGLVTGLNVSTQNTQNKMRQQRVAAAIGAQPHEIEMAENRLQREKLDTERLKLRMSSEKAKTDLDELRRLETRDILGMMNGLTAEQRTAFLRKHPIYDEEVSDAVQTTASHFVIQAINQKMYKKMYDDASEGNFDYASTPSIYLDQLLKEFDVAALDPIMRASIEERTTSFANGIARGIQANSAAQEQAQVRDTALANLDYYAASTLDHALTSVDDDDLREAFAAPLELIGAAHRISGEDEASLRRRFVAGLTKAASEVIKRNPTDLDPVFTAVDRGMGDDAAMQQALGRGRFREHLRAVAEREIEDRREQAVGLFTQEMTTEANRSYELDDLERLRAIDMQLANLAPDGIAKHEFAAVQTEVRHQITRLEKGRENTTAVLEALRTKSWDSLTTEQRAPENINRAFNLLQRNGMGEFTALSYMVEGGSDVPSSMRTAFEAAVTPAMLDIPRAMQIERTVRRVNPPLADRLILSQPEHGEVINVLSQFSAGRPLTHPDVTMAIGVASTPQGAASMMTALGKLRGPSDSSLLGAARRGEQFTPHLDIREAVQADTVTPDMIGLYESHFIIRYAELASRRPDMDDAQLTAYARQSAKSAISGRFATLLGQPIRADQLSASPEFLNDPTSKAWLDRTVQTFSDWANADGVGKASPALAIPSGGKSYIPAGDDVNGVGYFLELEPASMRFRVIANQDSGPGIENDPVLFRRLEGMFAGSIEPEQFSDEAPLLWKRAYVERTVRGYDRRYGSHMGRLILNAVRHRWEDQWTEHADSPRTDTPEFEQFADAFVRALGWDGWDDAPRVSNSDQSNKTLTTGTRK